MFTEYLLKNDFEQITEHIFVRGDIRIKLFGRDELGSYKMFSITSIGKNFPKIEYSLNEPFEDIISQYFDDKDFYFNEFKIECILLDKKEKQYGSYVCNMEFTDRGGDQSIVPVYFYGRTAKKVEKIQEQSRVLLTFKLSSIYIKMYNAKIVAIDVKDKL